MTRPRIPAGCRRISLGWEHDGLDFTILGYLTREIPEVRWGDHAHPAEPSEFYPLALVDGAGVERPELLPLLEAELDELTAQAVEDARDADEGAAEDRADAERDERRMGR